MLCVVAFGAMAQSAVEKGRQIATDAGDRAGGYDDYTVSGQMILRNKDGRESERRFDFKNLETDNGSMGLLVFNWPGDIRDTSLLTHSFDNRDSNQWLFLPAVRRVKRISGSGRSGSFVGSEFAFEDMTIQGVDEFSFEWIRDEPCPGAESLTCHVIDRVPDQESGYSRQQVWFDTAELRALRVDFFDRRGAKLKTMNSAGFQLHNGRFWRPQIIRMTNHLTGKSSDLLWSGYRFGVGLREGQFSVNALENLR